MTDWRALAELARLSNLPTVWSNVLVGLYCGFTARLIALRDPAPLPDEASLLREVLAQGAPLLVAISCFYIAGMVLNDVVDLAWDLEHRPERPLPSGRVAPRTALGATLALMLVGWAGLAWLNEPRVLAFGGALVACVILYDLVHKRTPWAVLLMGGCRALVYFTAAAAFRAPGEVWWQVVAPFALVLFLYTVLLTVVARAETRGRLDARRWGSILILAVALAPALVVIPTGGRWVWAMIAAVALAAWLGRAAVLALARPPRTRDAVLGWLSGFALLDAFFLTLLGQPLPALLAGVCFILTVLAHRRVAGT